MCASTWLGQPSTCLRPLLQETELIRALNKVFIIYDVYLLGETIKNLIIVSTVVVCSNCTNLHCVDMYMNNIKHTIIV